MTSESRAKSPEQIKKDAERLIELVMPILSSKRNAFRASERSFVHYTTGENALAILRDKRFWLRSTVCMNDFTEVQHGHRMLLMAFQKNDNALRTRFINALDAVHPGIAAEAIRRYDEYFQINAFRVFIGCLSEHDPIAHRMGRLSMWRAYGNGKTPVALVLNKEGLFTESDSANLYMSPVAYLNDDEMAVLAEKIVANIENNVEFLKSFEVEMLTRAIFVTLLFTAICLKHPGFAEEQEWRLIYLPRFAHSPIVEEALETINGVPQHVYKVPLQNRPDHGVMGIEVRDILQGVIVGPTSFPFPVCEAFVDVLNKSGVTNAYGKVSSASIPLRT